MSDSIILFGGTFDPIHQGHLHIADLADKIIQPDSIQFIPCKSPVHKSSPGANANQRLEMLQLALFSNTNYVIDDIEIKRDCESYAVTTIQTYREKYPDTLLFWLMGTDSLQQFKQWYQWEKILTMCHLIAIERPQVIIQAEPDIPVHNNYNQSLFHKHRVGHAVIIRTAGIDISSSEIRQHYWDTPKIRDSLPKSIENYISQHNLYKTG